MKENEGNPNVKLKIKPKYRLIYEFLTRNAGTFFVLLIIGALSNQYDFVLAAYAVIMIIYVIFVIFYLLYIKIKYVRTTYEFYDDKLIYTYKFIRKVEKQTLYQDIKEVRTNQRGLQMLFKQGDIVITTSTGNIFNNTVVLKDIANHKEVTEEIKKIVNK